MSNSSPRLLLTPAESVSIDANIALTMALQTFSAGIPVVIN
ncbi:MAG: hypothetical protein PF589_08940 [Gammaproteobacteria bacterium]|nr:hypothetical protein [Gammaproteobacteria bacterium]